MLNRMVSKAKAALGPKGLTMKQILKFTTASRKELSRRVIVRNFRFAMSRSKRVPKAMAKTYSLELNGLKKSLVQYNTAIEFHPKRKVMVSCSCEDFLYRWEYALNFHGASEITYSNGEVARETNPQNIPGGCKHLVRLYAHMVEQKLLDA